MARIELDLAHAYRPNPQLVEAFGFTGPDVDAEQILMGARLWQDLGLQNIRLEINSLGQPEERAAHRDARREQVRVAEGHRKRVVRAEAAAVCETGAQGWVG